jgi:hypothetical protein
MADPWAVKSVEKEDPWAVRSVRPAKRRVTQDVTGAAANLNRGLIIGDELQALGATAEGLLTGRHRFGLDKPGNPIVNNALMLRDAYTNELAGQRQREDEFSEARPRVAALSRGTGNALTMAAPVGPGAQAFATGGRAVNALRGATVASATGAATAALDRGSASERLAGASRASYDPVALGLGAGVGAAVGRSRPKTQKAKAPTLDELKAQKSAAYKAVDDSGVSYSNDDFADLSRQMTESVAKARFNAKLHPKTAAMLDYVSELSNRAAGHNPTLSELDDLRKVIGRDVSSSNDAGERMMGEIMRGKIDEFVDARAAGSAEIRKARDLNTRVRKIEALDGLDEAAGDRAAASGTGSNAENAQRQNVIRFKNQTKNLTPEEEAAANRVIHGNNATHNLLRHVGRLSPEGGPVSAGLSLVTGSMSGGTIPAVGFVARRVSDALTSRNVRQLRDLIATGGQPVAQEVQRQLRAAGADDLLQQLANDLSAAAGVQGASARGAATAYGGPR